MAKKIQKVLLLLIFPILFSSCASQGNLAATSADATGSFKKGVTTKTQVHSSLGQPHDVRSQDSDASRWSYYNTKMRPNAAGFIPIVGIALPDSNNEISIRHIYFDKRNKYQHSYLNKSKSKTNAFASVARGLGSFSRDTQHIRVKAEMDRLKLPYSKKTALKAKDMGTILGVNPEL